MKERWRCDLTNQNIVRADWSVIVYEAALSLSRARCSARDPCKISSCEKSRGYIIKMTGNFAKEICAKWKLTCAREWFTSDDGAWNMYNAARICIIENYVIIMVAISVTFLFTYFERERSGGDRLIDIAFAILTYGGVSRRTRKRVVGEQFQFVELDVSSTLKRKCLRERRKRRWRRFRKNWSSPRKSS